MSAQYYGKLSKSRQLPTRFYRPLALTTLTVAAALSSQAHAAGPTIYGKLNLSAQHYKFEKLEFGQTGTPASYLHSGATAATPELEQWAIESNASRFGIKGDLAINDELKLVYLVEYGIDADNGTNSNGRELSQRNIYAGIEGRWGTLLLVKNDSPLKTLLANPISRSDIDRFHDAALADIGSYLVGENRPDNVIQYNSPIFWQGFEFKLAAVQNEETGVPVSTSNPQDDDGLATGYSSSLTYGKASWFVGVALDSNVAATDAVRLTGEISFGPLKLGAIYQNAEQHDDSDRLGPFSTFVGSSVSASGAQNGINPIGEWDGASGSAFKEQDGYVLNAVWKVSGPWSAKLQYGHSKTTPLNPAYAGVKADALALGLDYRLNEAARLYSYYAQLDTEGDAAIGTAKPSDRTFALGLDFRF